MNPGKEKGTTEHTAVKLTVSRKDLKRAEIPVTRRKTNKKTTISDDIILNIIYKIILEDNHNEK